MSVASESTVETTHNPLPIAYICATCFSKNLRWIKTKVWSEADQKFNETDDEMTAYCNCCDHEESTLKILAREVTLHCEKETSITDNRRIANLLSPSAYDEYLQLEKEQTAKLQQDTLKYISAYEINKIRIARKSLTNGSFSFDVYCYDRNNTLVKTPTPHLTHKVIIARFLIIDPNPGTVKIKPVFHKVSVTEFLFDVMCRLASRAIEHNDIPPITGKDNDCIEEHRLTFHTSNLSY